jgi:hypothetical protein
MKNFLRPGRLKATIACLACQRPTFRRFAQPGEEDKTKIVAFQASRSSFDRYRTNTNPPNGYSSVTCLLPPFIIHCADIEVRVPLLLCVPILAFLSFISVLFSSAAFLKSSFVSFSSSSPLTTNLDRSGSRMPWRMYRRGWIGFK